METKNEKIEKNITLPFTSGDLLRFLLALLYMLFSIAAASGIFGYWKSLYRCSSSQAAGKQILLAFMLAGEYCLISLAVVFYAALVKRGFDKLNPPGKWGLIPFLLLGLVVGLVLGFSLIPFIEDIAFGIFMGLFYMFVFIGLVLGIKQEFKDSG